MVKSKFIITSFFTASLCFSASLALAEAEDKVTIKSEAHTISGDFPHKDTVKVDASAPSKAEKEELKRVKLEWEPSATKPTKVKHFKDKTKVKSKTI